MPVMSAPVSISACTVCPSPPARLPAVATSLRMDRADQPGLDSQLTTSGFVSTDSTFPSLPGSYWQPPRSIGSKLEGVPLKPMRRPKRMDEPSSCPHALILVA